jgi:hypothetical protein
MSLPIKMNLDGNRLLQQDNTSNYAMNANFSSESNAIHNEYGFIEVERVNGIKIVGWKKIFNNQIILCSQVDNENYKSEIGILKDNKYTTIIRDNVESGALFNFTDDNLIQIEAKLNINHEIIIYFVDGKNSDKFLNITNLQVKLASDLRILNLEEFRNMIGFRLNTDTNIYLEDTDVGGSLYSGVYYVLATFWNKGGIKSHSLVVSNPIPIASTNTFIDGLPANTLTSRRILVSLKVNEIDDNFDYYTIYCISKINQTIKAYEINTSEIPENDFTVDISNLSSATEVTPDSIILNSSDYISSLTLTQVDDVLFKGNLKSIDEFDFQPYVNNTIINYTSKSLNLDDDSYAESTSAFYSKSFMFDEVYALYQSYIIEENGITYETKAYHIPGRAAKTTIQSKLENAKINTLVTEPNIYTTNPSDALTEGRPLNEIKNINPEAKIFQGLDTADVETANGNMQYWENENEFYSQEDKWIVRDKTGVILENLRGINVRHHRFPPAYNNNGGIPNMIVGGNLVNVLGFAPVNIVIPDAWKDKIKGVKFYYAKRNLENRTILGQSLAIPQHQRHRFEFPHGIDERIFSATGSFYIQDIFMNNPFPTPLLTPPQPPVNNGEGFAPTNIRRAPFETTIYDQGLTERGPYPDRLAGFGYYCFPEQSGSTVWNTNSGFITMHPFDAMLNNTNLKGNYIKNVCRIKSKYVDGSYVFGSSWYADEKPWIYSYIFDSRTSFFGIDRGEAIDSGNYYRNQIRRTTNVDFYGNTDQESQGGPYWAKYSGNRICVEFPNRLYSGTSTYAGINNGQDFAIVCLQSPETAYTSVGLYRGDGDSYASPYLTNICAYKEDLFGSFDNQILCSTGFSYKLQTSGNLVVGKTYLISKMGDDDDFSNVGGANFPGARFVATGTTPTRWLADSVLIELVELEGIFGGDTFTSLYGERATIDFDRLFRHPAGTSNEVRQQQLRTTHYYICQSTSNIRLRYEGTNSWEKYFPKSLLDSIPAWYSNYYGYNIDYSSVNDISQPVQELNRLDNNTNVYPNRIIKSQVNNPELLEDNYLIFNPGDVNDVGLQYGQIENLFSINNKLAIHLTNDLMLTMNKQTMDTSSGKAYIGAGDIFSVKPQDVNSNYYGGTVGRYSGVMTPYGYFFIDPLSYKVFNFDGNQLNIISGEGMERYFFNYGAIQLPTILNNFNDQFILDFDGSTVDEGWIVRYNGGYWEALGDTNTIPGTEGAAWKKINLPNYNPRSSVAGLGFTVAYDTFYDRIVFSKRDYVLDYITYTGIYRPGDTNQVGTYMTYNSKFGFYYEFEPETGEFVVLPEGWFQEVPYEEMLDNGFKDNGFTLAYYPNIKSWVSFYSYKPELLIGGSQNFFSSKNNTIYEHNQRTSPFYYDSQPIEWFVEPLFTGQGNNRLASISLKSEKTFAGKYDSLQLMPKNTNPNVAQSETFDSYFVYNKNQMSIEKDFINTKTSRDAEGYFNINDFRDFTAVTNPVLFTITSNNKVPQTNLLNPNLHWTKQRKFVDFWQSVRLSKSYSEFVDLGLQDIINVDDVNFLEYDLFNTLLPKSILKIVSESRTVYATIDGFPTTPSFPKYKLRLLFGELPLDEGEYQIEVFNGYNLSLLDISANKKQSIR